MATQRAVLLLLLSLCAWLGAHAGQPGPFPQLYGRPTLFCPPGNYAEGLTARIEADRLIAQDATTTTPPPLTNDELVVVRCAPCPVDTFSDGTDAWGLEACHPCPEGTTAPAAGATACAALLF